MRRAAVLVFLASLAGMATPAPAAAEWQIAPTIGITFGGKTTLQDLENASGNLHPTFGIVGTYLTSGIIGFEGIAALTPGFFQAGSDIIETSRTSAIMGNVVITVPPRWAEYSLRPFISGGIGLMRSSQVDKREVLPVSSNVAGFNIGGGAVGYFSKTTGVRFDFRYYRNLRGVDQGPIAVGDVHLRYMTATVGFVFRL
jgi:hypothetical protein